MIFKLILLLVSIKCRFVLGVEDFIVNEVEVFKNELPLVDHLEVGEQYNCGGTSRSPQTLIQSPNYPNNYGSNLNCKYVIKSPNDCDSDFEVKFIDFDIETSDNCTNDWVNINDEELLCGSVIGIKRYAAINNELIFKFKSNAMVERTGFRVFVSRMACEQDPSTIIIDETTTDMLMEESIDDVESDLTTEAATIYDFEENTVPSGVLLPPIISSRSLGAINGEIEQTDVKKLNQYLPPSNRQYLPPSNNYPSTSVCYPYPWYSNSNPNWNNPGTVPPSWNQQPQNPPNWNTPSYPMYPTNTPPTWNQPQNPPTWNQPQNPPTWNQNYPTNPDWNYPTQAPPTWTPPASPVPPIWPPVTSNPSDPGSSAIPPVSNNQPPAYPVPPIYTYPTYPSNQYLPSNPSEKQIISPTGQCCTTSFNQRRFYLVSPGFPSNNLQRKECAFTITKNNQNVCRLRINIKFLVMGESNEVQLGCINDFIQIDNARLCGCRTGISYVSDWLPGTLGSKIIYYKSSGGYTRNTRGFVLEIIQEDCSGQYRNVGANPTRLQDRNWSPHQTNQQQVLVPHTATVQTNSTSYATYYYYDPPTTTQQPDNEFETREFSIDGRENGQNSRFFFSNGLGLGGNTCVFGLTQWVRLSAEALFVSKPVCYPPRTNYYNY